MCWFCSKVKTGDLAAVVLLERGRIPQDFRQENMAVFKTHPTYSKAVCVRHQSVFFSAENNSASLKILIQMCRDENRNLLPTPLHALVIMIYAHCPAYHKSAAIENNSKPTLCAGTKCNGGHIP